MKNKNMIIGIRKATEARELLPSPATDFKMLREPVDTVNVEPRVKFRRSSSLINKSESRQDSLKDCKPGMDEEEAGHSRLIRK